jgi:hypothetical protein
LDLPGILNTFNKNTLFEASFKMSCSKREQSEKACSLTPPAARDNEF